MELSPSADRKGKKRKITSEPKSEEFTEDWMPDFSAY
jgi:hypothetical protein